MDLIVAVYDDWGIGCDGTQPVTLSADRKFFREQTRGRTVILGRRTMEDFPGKRPLPGRENIVLTGSARQIPGFTCCASVEKVLALTRGRPATVIGGGSVYRQLLPFCDRAYVTRIHAAPKSDTFFPNLEEDPGWTLEQVLGQGEENGVAYEMTVYRRVP